MAANDSTPPRGSRPLWIVGYIGIVIVLVGGGFLFHAWWTHHTAELAAQKAARAKAVDLARVELAVCQSEIFAAEQLGIVPVYAKLTSQTLLRTKGNHYICVAGTHLTHYYMLAELRCNRLPDCIVMDRIAVQNGPLVYARPQ